MKVLESLLFMLNQMSPYILLGFLIAGLIYAFVPQKMMSRHLAGTGFGSVFKAALFGVPLPLCSCGVLPTAIGLRRSGASRAASTSFLIATPQRSGICRDTPCGSFCDLYLRRYARRA